MTKPSALATNSAPKLSANPPTDDLLPPSILIVDDEKQIHSSLRLRLSSEYQLTCLNSPREALALIGERIFDLCITDIHMPDMDGLAFIEAAREIDPGLGYVVLSGFDSDENLRRTIPLQVLDFIAKPLPDRTGFEKRIADWIAHTRNRRRELALAKESGSIERELELALIERDVESTASESAREALLQTASLLTTIQALLFSAKHTLEPLHRTEARLATIFRGLQEALRNTENAGNIAEGYFGSAYADRESSPAIIGSCLQHAVKIGLRLAKAEERQQSVDLVPFDRDLTISRVTGIDFLLMFVPIVTQMLTLAAPATTVQIRCAELTRIGNVTGDMRLRSFLWVNRRNATVSDPGIQLSIRINASALDEATIRAWLGGNTAPALHVPSRGVLRGIQKAKGLLGVAVKPATERFEIVLALPVSFRTK